MTSGWEGFDFSSSLTLSCGEAVSVTKATNVIDIPAARRGDVALRCFAYVSGEWQTASFSTNVDQITVTVAGGATGRRYRFDRPGARVVVDPRDRPSLAALPQLRLV